MAIKTHKLLAQVEKIMETFNPPWLGPALEKVKANMQQIYLKGG